MVSDCLGWGRKCDCDRAKLKQYHKKEREIRVAAEATNGLGEAPSLAFIETDLAALMLSDPARLGVKL